MKYLCLFLLILVYSFKTFSLTPWYYKYTGNEIRTRFDTMTSSWNKFTEYGINDATVSDDVTSPMTFSFNINGDFQQSACSASRQCKNANAWNCFRVSNGSSDSSGLTGIVQGKIYKPKCASNTNLYGDSYAVISNNNSGYGIGLLTWAGKKRGQSSSSVRTDFNVLSQAGHIGILGSYVNASIHKDNSIEPFKCDTVDCSFVATSWQKIKVASTTGSNGTNKYQVQQKIAFIIQTKEKKHVIINSDGERVWKFPGIEYAPTTYCQGYGCNYQNATIWVDSQQGSRTVIGGAIKSGQNSYVTLNGQSFIVFKGKQQSTQNVPSPDTKVFGIEITWDNWQNLITHETGRILGKQVANVTHHDRVSVFGCDYDSPSNWTLRKFHFGQEVKNNTYTSAGDVYIGGSMSKYWLEARE